MCGISLLNFEGRAERICFCGDIHGSFDSIRRLVHKNSLEDYLIVVCGDIGLGFSSKEGEYMELSNLNRYLMKRNNTCVLFRGNHDDPSRFVDADTKLTNVRIVRDYTVITACGKNMLCVGGGISVDRTDRISYDYGKLQAYIRYHPSGITKEEALEKCGRTYWEDEPPYFDSGAFDQIRSIGINIDIVCTHTCPSFCDPTHKNGIGYWICRDEKLSDDIDKERGVMDEIRNRLDEDGHNVGLWVYGHFHRHNMEDIGGTRYVMLDMEHGLPDIYEV